MDRRTLIALLLAMLAVQLYFTVIMPPPPTEEAAVPEEQEPAAESPAVAPEPASGEVPAPTSTELPVRDVPIEVCTVKGKLTTDGGYLRDVLLTDRHADYHAQALWQWVWDQVAGDGGPWVPYHPEPGLQHLLTAQAQFLGMGAGELDQPSPRVAVLEETPTRVVVSGTTANGIEVQRALTLRDDCTVDVEVTWKNTGTGAFTGPLWLTAHDAMPTEAGRYSNVARPIGMTDGSVTRWHDLSDLEEPEPYEGPVDWFGINDQYFAVYVIAPVGTQGMLVYSKRGTGDAATWGEYYAVERTLQPGESHTQPFRMYMGPKDLEVLRSVDPRLGTAVDLGWFAFFGKILLWLLKLFHSFVNNWGLAIILLTFLVKLVFYPLTNMSFKSSQAMQALQPKLAEIREKYADNQEEQNRRTIELFREHGVNPVGGCLPMLLQMPVWIALYAVLLSSVELYQTEFLYLKDLSSVDPYMVLPLIVVVLMVIQQQMMPMGNMDPAQQRIMKIMPIIFGVFFFTFPSGLVLYIFVNMVLTILQQWLIKRQYAAAAPA